ncbi:MAG TPA: hypothetical protein VM580_13645, partial [Labilithrix sp.]|nr:hypothetical protein [Labilithrix sp.]
LEMSRQGANVSATAAALTLVTTGALVASFVGAAISLAIGARMTATLALVVSALGSVFLAAQAPTVLGCLFLGAGAGLFRVCPYMAMAELVVTDGAGEPGASPASPLLADPTRFAAASAYAALLYAISHMASASAGVLTGILLATGSATLAFAVAAVIATIGILCAGGAVLVHSAPARSTPTLPPQNLPYRAPAPPAPLRVAATSPAQGLLGVAVLAIALGALEFGEGLAFDLSGDNIARLYGVVNATSTIASLSMLAILIVAGLRRWSTPPVPAYGVGITLAGFGLLLRVGAKTTVGIHLVGAILTSFGDAVVPIGAAYAALAVRGRPAAFVIATWMAVATAAGLAGGALAGTALRTPLLLMAGIASLVVGGVLAVSGRHCHKSQLWP